ncbi:lamin tail domain-containing protein [Candidatus Woesearchaeota archaeon]|nr:lamin tail domain-containing protein [Candidatus Woesearchaeota archaeon]
MNNMMLSKLMVRNLVVAMMALMTISSALAGPVISEVLYDPIGSENGGEAIELYNPTDNSIDIGGWKIASESSLADATLPQGALISAYGYYLITDLGWNVSKDNASWPSADHEETLSLTNVDAGVALTLPNGTVVDAVGWGLPENIQSGLFEGTPALGISSGQSLERKPGFLDALAGNGADSNNNSVDFLVRSSPDLQNSQSSEQPSTVIPNQTQTTTNTSLVLVVSISNIAPTFDQLLIDPDDDDDHFSDGYQVAPFPGLWRNVTVYASVFDQNGHTDIDTVTATFDDQEFLLHQKFVGDVVNGFYEGQIQIPYYQDAGVFPINFTATDKHGGVVSGSLNITILPVIGVALDTNALALTGSIGGTTHIDGDTDFSTTRRPTLRNIGNVPIDAFIKGTDLKDPRQPREAVDVGLITFSFADTFSSPLSGTLDRDFQHVDLNLDYGTSSVLPFSLLLGSVVGVPQGNYQGEISVMGVSS